MINTSASTLFVYDQEREYYISLDSEELRRELCDAFEACSVGASWMVDCILQALPEKLHACQDAGTRLTKEDVRMILASALDASGFADVSRAFLEKSSCTEASGTAAESIAGPNEQLPAWSPQSLTSTVRYISSDKWNLDLSADARQLLSERIIVLQSVSDILPLAVVQCRLGRMWDLPKRMPLDEADFISRLPEITTIVTECISQMRLRIDSEWHGIQQGIPIVRFVDFETLPQLLGVKKSRAARIDTEKRLAEKMTALFASGDLRIKTHFG